MARGSLEIFGAGPVAANDDLGGLVRMVRNAVIDQRLADELLALEPTWWVRTVQNPRYHRLSLAKLLVLQAEIELFAGSPDAGKAEAGAAVASALPLEDPGRRWQLVALGSWVAGKAYLRHRRWKLAERAFRASRSAADAAPTGDPGLASYGLAQLRLSQAEVSAGTGCESEAAVGHFATGVSFYSLRGNADPAAACGAQLGFLAATEGDLLIALIHLRRALLHLVDETQAPSLSARILLAIARCEARLGKVENIEGYVLEARALNAVSDVPREAVVLRWMEAHIAIEIGDLEGADRQLDDVRRELLLVGSRREVSACTFEQILVQMSMEREPTADLVTLLAVERKEFLREMKTCPQPTLEAHQVLRRRAFPFPLTEAGACTGEPSTLVSAEALADRLLRCLPEYGDPSAVQEDEV